MKIRIDIEDFDKAVAHEALKAKDRAIVSASNKTAPTVRLFVQETVKDRFGVKKTPVMKRVDLMKATRSSPYAKLNFSQLRNLPRIYFGARSKVVRTEAGKRKGATALVNGVRQFLPGAFIQTMPNGKIGVFERKGKQRRPIRQLFGTEIRDLFDRDAVFVNSLTNHSRQVFSKNFDHEFQFYLSKQKGSGE